MMMNPTLRPSARRLPGSRVSHIITRLALRITNGVVGCVEGSFGGAFVFGGARSRYVLPVSSGAQAAGLTSRHTMPWTPGASGHDIVQEHMTCSSEGAVV